MKGFLNHEELKKFIELVCLQPALYDPTAKHSDIQSSKAVWACIAADMNIPSMSVTEWKNKWKCLRDTFVKKKKEIRLADTQEKVDKASQWRFFSQMSFLDPFVDRISHKSVPKSNGNDYQHYTIIRNEEYEDDNSGEEVVDEGTYYYATKNSADESLTSNSSGTKRRRRKQDLETDTTGMSPNAVDDENDSTGEASCSKSFFMSCAYRMDKLPDRVQSYLQLQISQLFFNAENPDVTPVPIMPLPPSSSSSSS